MNDENNTRELSVKAFDELKKNGRFDISVCDSITNIDDNPKFKKLEMTTAQKMQMSALAGELPAFAGAKVIADAAKNSTTLYLVNCPLGIENTLRQMKNGNYANFIRKGSLFDGYAPINPVSSAPIAEVMNAQAVAMATFAAMSVATKQYYLKQINDELGGIKQGMDKILEFLYGDKKAELMSEISFAKYAYENYGAILAHSEQKAATLISLQEAKKVAMKDAEFYISDISSTMQENSGIETVVEKACQLNKSLDLAMQLAVMSSVLETYYAQNFDKEYLDYIDRELSLYIDKCDKFRLASFSKLHERVESFKSLPTKKIDKEALLAKLNEVLAPLQSGDESTLRKTLREGLYSSNKNSAYYLSSDGNVYIKTA